MDMDCRKIEQLISPFIDGELTRSEAEAIRVHLSACADCDREYEAMIQLAAACRSLSEIFIPAPKGFKDTLMLRISNEENLVAHVKSGSWFNRNWKQSVAGIAAGVLLIIGTLSMNSGPIVQVAENPPAVTQPSNPSVVVVGDPGNTSPTNPNILENQPPATGQNNSGDPVATISPATNSGRSPMVLLSKDLTISTTFLQVKVADSASVLQQAMSLANEAQAQTQNLGQQVDNNGSYTVLQIKVAKSAADRLINDLSNLGTVTGREVTKNDISSQFADKMSQYQILITQRTTLQDASQAASLDQRIDILENELRDWDQKAEIETIVLRLEK